MIRLFKIKSSVAIFVVLLVFPIGISTCRVSAEAPATDGTLTFLREVVKLDLAKYNVALSLGPFVDVRSDLGGLIDVNGQYSLKSQTSNIDAYFHIINGTLCSCHLYFTAGVPLYISPPPNNAVNAAKDFLQRYQTVTGDASLSLMSQMLNTIDGTKNETKESSNLKLTVSLSSYYTSFRWENIFNGAVFSSLSASFQDGIFYTFFDDRSYFRIGSSQVNVSKDQAVGIALEKSSDFWYNYGGQRYSNFTIRKQFVSAALYTKARSEPLVLYPYWSVTLPLDHMYPGHVTMIMVEIWADTSEVIRMYELGTGGGDVSPTSLPTPTASPTPSSSPTSQPSQAPTSDASPSPSVSASPNVSPQTSLSPSQSQQPSASASAITQPFESSSPTGQPSSSPQSIGSSEQTAGFPVQTAVAVVAVAAIVCVAVSAAWFLRKRRT